jgi:hypothetical protein
MRSSTIPRITDNGKTRYCSECYDGERKEIATVAISYYNELGRFVRNKHVCGDHAEMIYQDDSHARETVLLPRNTEEAAHHVSRMPPNLLEIVNGKRVGIPTLDSRDPLQRAAGILSGKEVSWLR